MGTRTNGIKNTLGSFWIDKIRDRLLNKNKNWLAIICGETGSGKSYSALSIANAIVMNGARVWVVFTPIEFLATLGNPTVKKGDVIIFDEAGVGMSSREWYSIQNKLLGAVLQTFRNMNIGVIFTTPNLSFIDVQARKLFHTYIETDHINVKAKIAVLKPYEITINVRFNKIYYNFPKANIDGKLVSISHIEVPKPSDKACAVYERYKLEYTKKLNKRAYDSVKEAMSEQYSKENPEVADDSVIS